MQLTLPRDSSPHSTHIRCLPAQRDLLPAASASLGAIVHGLAVPLQHTLLPSGAAPAQPAARIGAFVHMGRQRVFGVHTAADEHLIPWACSRHSDPTC